MLLILPYIILHIIVGFCIFMAVLFLVGLVCTIVGCVRMARSHECEELPRPVTKEAKKHMDKIHKTKGAYRHK